MKITPRFLLVTIFNLLIFSIPLYFRFDTEELFEFNKMILVYALTTIIGFFWILRMVLEKRLVLKRTPLDIPILAFVFSQFVSTIFSIHPYTSWLGYYSRFNGGFLSTLSYAILFYAFVSNFKKRELGGFLLSAFVSGLLVSVWGIFEHFGHSLSCLLLSTDRSFGVDCWVQDVQSRVYASFGQPNWLAAYVIMLLPVSFVASVQKKLPLAKRVLFTSTTLALFLVLLYTRSRSGMLGLVTGSAVFILGAILLFARNKAELFKKIQIPTLALIALAILSFSAYYGTSFTPSISSLINSQKEREQQSEPENNQDQPVVNRLEIGGTDSGEIRKIVWQGAYKVWQRYPIIGSGPETFAYSYYQDRLREHNDVSEWDFLYNKAHNELLNFLATTGIIGLLSYLSIFVVLGLITLQIILSPKYGETEKLISLALISGQTALFVSNFFGFSTVAVNVIMYIFFAITCIIYSDQKVGSIEKKLSKRTKDSKLDSSQYLGMTLAAIMCLFILFKIYNYWSADKAYAVGKNYVRAGEYQLGLQNILLAISKSPKEALFYDTLSDNYADLAIYFATTGEATLSAEFANESLRASNQQMILNNRHLNFYKTKASVMTILAQIDEGFLQEAKETLLQATQLAPTDPKLIYSLAVVEHTQGNMDEALKLYKTAIELKPNYVRPLLKVSEIYFGMEKYDEAIQPLDYILENITPNDSEVLEKKKEIQEKMLNQK